MSRNDVRKKRRTKENYLAGFIRSGIIILILLAAAMPARSQFFNNNRLAFWPALGIQKDIGEHWRIRFEHSTRMRFQPFMLDEIYFQAGGEYKLRYNIALKLNYRFSENYSPETQFTPEHRISIDGDLETNIKRWNLAFRPAVQAVFGGLNIEKNLNPEWALRPEGKIDYNIAKTSLNPFASFELYLGRRSGIPFSLYKYRFTIGSGYRLTKALKLDLFLRQQGGFNNSDQNSYTIFGTELTLRLR